MGFVETVTPVLALVAVAVSIAVGYGTIKQRKDEPNARRWREFEEWRAHVDAALDNDNHKISNFERDKESTAEFERVMLQAVMAMLAHMSDGNHGEQMREVSRKIEDYLIRR
jgi:hypothetical protein